MSARLRHPLAFALAAALLLPAVRNAHATLPPPSRLVLARLAPGGSGLLAQRAIDREWGPSDDSLYREVIVPGWRSEGGAMTLSALLPGAGQLYAGSGSAWSWLLGEAVGWAFHASSARRADRLRRDAANFVGNPYDTSATWSFARWQGATAAPTSAIEALWRSDREAFYERIAGDPAYVAGYAGSSPTVMRADFQDLRTRRDNVRRRVHTLEVLLWINHLASAIDAFHGAHVRNLPLTPRLNLGIDERGPLARPEVRLAFEGRF